MKLKVFYYNCKVIPSEEMKEVGVIAKSFEQAEEIITNDQNKKKYIPIEYLGWNDLEEAETNEERN